MTYPLTFASSRDYALSTSSNQRPSFAAREQGGQPPSSGFFTSVTHDMPFMGGSCGEPKGSPVLARSANPHVSARQFCSWGAENINRLARSMIMSKSKSASAPSKFISRIFNSKLPAGLKVTEYAWENEYRGTDAAFINAGLIKPEWLPGLPGNPKGRVMVGLVNGEMRILPAGPFPTDDQFNNGFIAIRRSSKGRLIVSIYCLKKEREKREEAGYLERKKRLIEEVRKEIDKGVAELTTSPGAYVWRGSHTIRAFANGIRSSLTDSFGYSGGYSFLVELIAEFDSTVARLNQMINDAPISFDEEKRQKEIVGIKNQVLAKYPGLTDKDIEQ